jgi:hypothetical protein
MTTCPPGCRCGRHQERTQDQRARLGAAVAAAAVRRRGAPAAEVWRVGRAGLPSHRRCLHCGRLLVPATDGRPPMHRKPPAHADSTVAVPLTGRDAPWCESRWFA